MQEKSTSKQETITNVLENWSDRKKTLFTNPDFVNIAIKNIQLHLV